MKKVLTAVGAITVVGTAALAVAMAIKPELKEHIEDSVYGTIAHIKSMCPCSHCDDAENYDFEDAD